MNFNNFMTMTSNFNKKLKSFMPNSILVTIENHNGNQIHSEYLPEGLIFKQTMDKLKRLYPNYNIKIYSK